MNLVLKTAVAALVLSTVACGAHKTERRTSKSTTQNDAQAPIEFRDRKFGERYVLFAKEVTYAEKDRVCEGVGMSVPPISLMRSVFGHGLGEAIARRSQLNPLSSGKVWARDPDEFSTHGTILNSLDPDSDYIQNKTIEALVLCIE